MPLDSRARWVRRILVAALVADAAAIASNYLEFKLLGTDFTLGEADANDTRQAVVTVGQLLVYTAAAILFIRWFSRAYKNLEPLGAVRRFSTGWAIGGWFVPILGVWRPKQIANDIWRGTDPTRHLGTSGEEAHVAPVVQWWWAAFLISAALQNVGTRLYVSGDDPASLRTSDVVSMIGDGLDAVAAALAIVVVGAITARESARAAARAQLESPEDGVRD